MAWWRRSSVARAWFGADLTWLAFSRRYEDGAAVLSRPVRDALPPGCDLLFLDVLACDNGHKGSAPNVGAEPLRVGRGIRYGRARAAGEPIGPIVVDYNSSLAERAVPEWQATLDALQALPETGTEAPVGYGGLTFTAAAFGGGFVYEALTEAAGQITIRIEFPLPWDDEEINRQSGLALVDACASKEKVLYAYPGRHNQVPRFEVDNSARFFVRHLGRVGTSRA